MASFPMPPADMDIYESQQTGIYVSILVTLILSVVSVALRLLCRLKLTRVGLWWDDYLIIISLFLAMACVGSVVFIAVFHGVGRHIWALPNPLQSVYYFRLGLFVGQLFYNFSLHATKISILLFYWRIFSARRSMRIAIWTMSGILVFWLIVTFFISIFQCTPISAAWDASVGGTCRVDLFKFMIGSSVPHFISDCIILLLPVPFIWGLHQRSWLQKLLLIGTFCMGTFICIISIYRLTILVQQQQKQDSIDVTWLFTSIGVWTCIEILAVIIAACLPSLQPLMAIIGKKTRSVYGNMSTGRGGTTNAGLQSSAVQSSQAGYRQSWKAKKDQRAYLRSAEQVSEDGAELMETVQVDNKSKAHETIFA